MSDDLIKQAARSLRDAPPIDDTQVDAVRARIMSSVRKRERRSARVVYFLVPAAAVLVASSALAGGGRWEKFVERLGWHRAVAPSSVPAERAPSRSIATPPPERTELAPPSIEAPEMTPPAEPPAVEPATPPAVEPATPSVNAAPPPPIAALASARKSARSRPSALAPAPDEHAANETANTPPAKAEPSLPAEVPNAAEAKALAVYREAHNLHFRTHDYAAAIAKWEEYLRLAPRGSLAVEARYNHALALVRAGRTSEARAELAHFAQGEIAGGYRKQEARTLLEALETNPSP